MTEDDIRALLRQACDEAGSQAAWARLNGVSWQYVADTLASRRGPGEKLLRALGVEKVVSYRKIADR